MKKVFAILLTILLICASPVLASSIVKVVPVGATNNLTWEGKDLGETDVYLGDPPYEQISNMGADPYIFRVHDGEEIYSKSISVAAASDFNWALVVRGMESGGSFSYIRWQVSYDGGQNFIDPGSYPKTDKVLSLGTVDGTTYVNFTGVRADYVRFILKPANDTRATIEFIYQKD